MRIVERPTWGLVLGGGEGVWLEVLRLEAMLGARWPGLIVGVNNAGADWPGPLDHLVSCHPEKLHSIDPADGTGGWVGIRKERGYSGGYKTWARRAPTRASVSGSLSQICTASGRGSSFTPQSLSG